MSWKRPEDTHGVEDRKKGENGETLRSAIPDLPKGMETDAIDFMTKYFLTEEPICAHQEYQKPTENLVIMSTELWADHIDLSGMSWKRPEGPHRVWRTVEGRKKDENGETLRFAIQDLPKGMETDAIDFMTKYFLTEEPICAHQELSKDPLTVTEYRTIWKYLLGHGVTVVALRLGSNPNEPPTIAGMNLLAVLTIHDGPVVGNLQLKSEKLRRLWNRMLRFSHEAQVFEKYQVEKQLTAVGLIVHPSFRGQGLGEEILRVRDEIGKTFDIPLSETIFTAKNSQILATRVGFHDEVVVKYSEFLDDEGNVAFPGINQTHLKLMVKRFSH